MLACWISSKPARTACSAVIPSGMWPLTRMPRRCASSTITGTSSGLSELYSLMCVYPWSAYHATCARACSGVSARIPVGPAKGPEPSMNPAITTTRGPTLVPAFHSRATCGKTLVSLARSRTLVTPEAR
jgi:hypothetical protein